MRKILRATLLGLATFLVCALVTTSTMAGDYPTKPIQLISPYGAGGDSDMTARIWAEFAQRKLGQPVVVVNKTGGGGLTGSLFAASAKADGYTLFLAQAGPSIIMPLTTHAGYDFNSFDYIARIMVANCAVVANPEQPYNDLAELAAKAKDEPGKIIFASPSATSWLTFAMRNWQNTTGCQLKQVEYQSGAEATTAVLGKHADMTFLFPQNYVPMAKAGKLKILAVGAKSEDFPEAPTFAELGYKGNYFGWGGIAAPKGTPKDVLEKLTAVTEEITKDPEFIKAIKNMGAAPDFTPGEKWISELNDQTEEMRAVLTSLGMLQN
jgi:tripartite-type tricarboxylate transporter receptor subunit TctC